MAELKVYLSEELDKRFRILAMNIFGYGRGSLSEAAVEALSCWCKEHESNQDDLHGFKGSGLESDPVARAEERPGQQSRTKEKANGPVPDQGGNDETVAPGSNGRD